MAVTTPTIYGDFALPDGVAIASAKVSFKISGMDTQNTTVLIPYGIKTYDLIDGELPGDAVLWRNSEGLRNTFYVVTLIITDVNGNETIYKVGKIQLTGTESTYNITLLLQASASIISGDLFHVLTDAELLAITTALANDLEAAEAAAEEATQSAALVIAAVAPMPEHYGAIGNGIADDSAAINAWIAAGANGRYIEAKSTAVYRCSNYIRLVDKANIDFKGAQIVGDTADASEVFRAPAQGAGWKPTEFSSGIIRNLRYWEKRVNEGRIGEFYGNILLDNCVFENTTGWLRAAGSEWAWTESATVDFDFGKRILISNDGRFLPPMIGAPITIPLQSGGTETRTVLEVLSRKYILMDAPLVGTLAASGDVLITSYREIYVRPIGPSAVTMDAAMGNRILYLPNACLSEMEVGEYVGVKGAGNTEFPCAIKAGGKWLTIDPSNASGANTPERAFFLGLEKVSGGYPVSIAGAGPAGVSMNTTLTGLRFNSNCYTASIQDAASVSRTWLLGNPTVCTVTGLHYSRIAETMGRQYLMVDRAFTVQGTNLKSIYRRVGPGVFIRNSKLISRPFISPIEAWGIDGIHSIGGRVNLDGCYIMAGGDAFVIGDAGTNHQIEQFTVTRCGGASKAANVIRLYQNNPWSRSANVSVRDFVGTGPLSVHPNFEQVFNDEDPTAIDPTSPVLPPVPRASRGVANITIDRVLLDLRGFYQPAISFGWNDNDWQNSNTDPENNIAGYVTVNGLRTRNVSTQNIRMGNGYSTVFNDCVFDKPNDIDADFPYNIDLRDFNNTIFNNCEFLLAPTAGAIHINVEKLDFEPERLAFNRCSFLGVADGSTILKARKLHGLRMFDSKVTSLAGATNAKFVDVTTSCEDITIDRTDLSEFAGLSPYSLGGKICNIDYSFNWSMQVTDSEITPTACVTVTAGTYRIQNGICEIEFAQTDTISISGMPLVTSNARITLPVPAASGIFVDLPLNGMASVSGSPTQIKLNVTANSDFGSVIGISPTGGRVSQKISNISGAIIGKFRANYRVNT